MVSRRATSDRLRPVSSRNSKVVATGSGSEIPDDSKQVVEAALLRERAHLFQQVLAQGAADAAVRHLDQGLVRAGKTEAGAAAAAHEIGVDVHLAHVVDDNGHAPVLAVAQHVVEKGRLARAEKAGQHGYGQAIVQGRAACAHAGSPSYGCSVMLYYYSTCQEAPIGGGIRRYETAPKGRPLVDSGAGHKVSESEGSTPAHQRK
jgi:hypothetical protein